LKKHNTKLPVQPNRAEEENLFFAGYHRIAGLDEAGRGALAGPVVAAAVVLPRASDFPWLKLVRDSKLLRESIRNNIFVFMQESGIEFGIGIIPPQLIDCINILNATKKAMKLALDQLAYPPDYVLTDAVALPRLPMPQKNIIKGDRMCLSIACASVVAKVTRDHIMIEFDAIYPQYKFRNHKGYGTREHIDCLRCHGASEIHRLTFAPVKDLTRLI
jgi:ribonuclease HII